MSQFQPPPPDNLPEDRVPEPPAAPRPEQPIGDPAYPAAVTPATTTPAAGASIRVIDPDDAPIRPTRSGCLYGIAGAVGCTVLLLIIPITLVALGVTTINSLIGGIGGLFGAGTPPQARVISTQTIVQGIQPLGQLVSVSAQLAKADVTVNINQGPLNTCGFSADHVAQGAVEAGIDLTQIGENSLIYDAARETYVLTVPAPQLTSCRIDYIRQYTHSFTTCTVDLDEARIFANYQAMIDFRNDAVEGGILGRAETEARTVLGNFVRVLTGHPVEIVFQEPETPMIPPSCEPTPPEGWTYLADSNLWFK